MGRFNWNSGHSKQSSGHKNIFPQEWFNKTTTEPSRQALNDLMKEYATERSDGSNTTRSRSRTDTTSSIRSFYARSSSEQPSRHHSRPVSRQSNIEDRSSPIERSEFASRGLLSKGTRLIRRHGNKSISQQHQRSDSQYETDDNQSMYEISPTRSSTPGLMYSPRRELTRNISAPFGFQHVTHTEHSDFESLSKATGDELATEFSAVQAGQEPVAGIKGIPVEELATVRASPKHSRVQSPTSPVPVEHGLPMTPPRPPPPPKDLLLSPFSPVAIRPSRSAENFSRPTRSPVPSANSSPFGDHLTSISLMSPISGFSTSPPTPTAWTESEYQNIPILSIPRRSSSVHNITQVKPLPLLPASLHAVALNEENMHSLRNASMPHTPLPLPDVPEEDDAALQSMESGESQPAYHRSSLRHSQTFPSDKALNRISVVVQDKTDSVLLISSRSATPSPTKSTRPKKRISIGLKTIAIHNWEDAIDYSWDHPEDLEDDAEAESHLDGLGNACNNIHTEALLGDNQPSLDQPSSVTSTPLMMLQSPASKKANQPDVLLSSTEPKVVDTEESSSALQGLGIASILASTVSQDNDYFQEKHYNVQQPSRRESLLLPLCYDSGLPTTPMSTSSSFDSLALSESSSASGTQRSSHSSTGLEEFTHVANYDATSLADSWLVPIRLDTATTVSSSTSQETVKVIQPADLLTELTDSLSAMGEPFPTSPSPFHGRGASVPEVPNSNRTSSILSDDTIRPLPLQHRSCSSTSNIRIKKPLRVSYSLFPTIQPQHQVTLS